MNVWSYILHGLVSDAGLEKFLWLFLEVREGVANAALNCKAILCIELAGSMDMGFHIPSTNRKDFQLSSSTVFRKLGL